MSNKTQLATNNTQLASLIQTLQGKAAGGGGGTLRVFPFGEISEFIQLPDDDTYYGNSISYACGLDEIDFNTLNTDNLTALYCIEGEDASIGEQVTMGTVFSGASSFKLNVGTVGICEALIAYPGDDGSAITHLPVLLKLTEENIAALGLSIEPGVYVYQITGMAAAVVYLAP